MKKFLLALLMVCSTAFAADTTTYYSIGDDGYAVVPLPFAFPMGGQSFTTSFFFSNGVVGFLQPQTTFCCDGYNLSQQSATNMSFAIYALQTDLIAANPAAAFYTTTDASSYLSYHWQNINEYGTGNLNTFSTTIRPTGSIALDYQNVNVQNHNITVGVTGDILAGQFNQYYSGPGSQFSVPTSPINYNGTSLVDYCTVNPLYSTTCSGYAEAYFAQQCTISPLYNPSCPGYAQAYLNYECSINPLYSTVCEGYSLAYFNQQCELDALYDRQCPGYAEAYALANIEEPVVQTTQPTTTTTTVAVIADPVVNRVVTSTTTTTSPAAVAAPVTLTPTTQNTAVAATVASTTETKSENKPSTETKPAQPTAREQVAAKRKEAAMQTAVKAGAEAAEKLDSATSMASQVKVQDVVLQAMGYMPGFSAYSYVMPDGNGYKPFTVYKNQKNVDNRLVEGGLTAKSDRLHQQLIELQYKE